MSYSTGEGIFGKLLFACIFIAIFSGIGTWLAYSDEVYSRLYVLALMFLFSVVGGIILVANKKKFYRKD